MIYLLILIVTVTVFCFWYFEPFSGPSGSLGPSVPSVPKRPHHPQKYKDLPEDHPDVQAFYKESLSNRDKTEHYHPIGYKKTKMPKKVFNYLKAVCETTDRIKEEVYPRSSSGPPPYLIPISEERKKWITEQIHPIVEKWIGIPLKHEATYGPREYLKRSALRSHVDRNEHIISAILHIGRETNETNDEDWALQVIGHDSPEKKEIYMKPGDLVLYESRSVMHGREKPCPYDYYRNIFLHWSPTKLTPS